MAAMCLITIVGGIIACAAWDGIKAVSAQSALSRRGALRPAIF